MKKLFLIALLFLIGKIGYSQYPNSFGVSNSNTQYYVKGGFGADSSFVFRTAFADTTAANRGWLDGIPGCFIRTTGGFLWVRNDAATAWIYVGGGAGTGTNIYNSNGSLTGDRVLSGTNLYNLGFDAVTSFRAEANAGTGKISSALVSTDSIFFQPNEGIFIIDSLASGASTDSVLVWTQATGRVKKRSYSSFTPTWQQTLTAGSTFTTDNTINSNGYDFAFNGQNIQFSASDGVDLTATLLGNTSNLTVDGSQIVIRNQRTGASSYFDIRSDSLLINPHLGYLVIDTIPNISTQNTLLGWKQGTGQGQVGYVTLGSGLYLSSGVLNTSGTVPTPISSLTAATGTNNIDNGTRVQQWNWNTLANNSGLVLNSTSTTAAGNAQTLLYISSDGTNATSSQTTYGQQINNAHDGTSSTNVGIKVAATNATNNYAIIVPASSGSVGIGTSTPTSLLHVNGVAQIGTAGSTLGQILMSGNTSGTVTLKTAAAAGTWSLTLPTNDGDASQVLTTDGSGVTSWTTPASTSPAGNFGNLQINRNGAFATPASDSLDFESATGLSVKGDINGTTNGVFNTQNSNKVYLGSASGFESFPGIWFGSSAPNITSYAFLADIAGGKVAINANSGAYVSFRNNNNDIASLTSTGFGIGTNSPVTPLHIISTTGQARIGYDASNYYSTTVGSTGGVTFNAVGSGASFAFEDRTTMTSTRFQTAKGANVASAGDLTLGADGNVFHITGTTTINAITTANWQAGSEITLIFDASVTVKHNTAGGGGTAVMILQGAADLAATANDVLKLVYDGTSWFCVSWSVN